MRAGRWQRVPAPWAVRRQSDATVGTELPVGFDLALAIVTRSHELLKFLTEFQE